MTETLTRPDKADLKKKMIARQQEEDDWPLEEINKPLDSPEEFIKVETGPSLEE